MKNKIVFLLAFFLFFQEIGTIFAITWDSEIKECYSAYTSNPKDLKKMWNIKNPYFSKRYLACQWPTVQDAIYQATLDVLFSEIDKNVETYLKTIWNLKSPTESGDNIAKKFSTWWDFDLAYLEVCKYKAFETSAKIVEENKWPLLNTNNYTKTMFDSSGGKCQELYEKKLRAYEDAAWVILYRETVAKYEKDKKTFMVKIKEEYRKLLFKFTIYLWQLWVISDKWNRWSKQCDN